MNKKGFTLLELLICVSLISVVIIFLFRLLNDIQNEEFSNSYITANQTNRNEIISKIYDISNENGDLCEIQVETNNPNNPTIAYVTLTFCNNKILDITVKPNSFHYKYDGEDYNYVMPDSMASYSPKVKYTISSYGGIRDDSYYILKLHITTERKGLKSTNVDDLEMMFSSKNRIIDDYSSSLNSRFSYTGQSEMFKAPETGTYLIQAWGAQGGYSLNNNSRGGSPGPGGYAEGKIYLTKNEKLYIYVGGKGSDGAYKAISAGGWNGGGNGHQDNGDDESGGAGGGATDIRLVLGNNDSLLSLSSRIMIAGGGGGSIWNDAAGGAGGGLQGVAGRNVGYPTQINGYSFGVGQSGLTTGYDSRGSAGAGGGYWGGYSNDSTSNYGSTSGGSGYISGHNGTVAVNAALDISPKTGCFPNSIYTDCTVHYSGKRFYETVLKSGNEEIPSYEGTGTTIGNYGNGFVIITYIDANNIAESYPEPQTMVDFNVPFSGYPQPITIEQTGYYKLEVWGAQGGSSTKRQGGKGGYSVGTINLNQGDNLYVYVGGHGQDDYNGPNAGILNGGFNGGGYGRGWSHGNANGGGGGGATDIRLNTDSLYSRVIVAGGGGGTSDNGDGGYAGGLNSNNSATQTTGFAFGSGQDTPYTGGEVGGGGSGWYGGTAGASENVPGNGGSGYVYTSSTAVNYPEGCLLDSSNYLTDASTVAGNQTFKSPTGEDEVGHSGDGYAKITYLGATLE